MTSPPETPRPSVGLRHYIPLFFLAPSMLLLVHAWNRTAPPEPRVFVEIESGGFDFPRDVRLEVEWGDDVVAPVSGRIASFVAPGAGAAPLTLHVAHANGSGRVPVGEPMHFELASAGKGARCTLRVSPTDCVRALERLRAPR